MALEVAKSQSVQAELVQLRYQVGQYELAKAACNDERATLLERVRHINEELLPELTQSKMEAMRAKSEALSALNDMCQAKDHAERHGPGVIAAQKARDEAIQQMSEQKIDFQEQLQQLLAEQRKTFEDELPARLSGEARELAERLRLRELEMAEEVARAEADGKSRLEAEVEEHEKTRKEVTRLTGLLAGKTAAAFGKASRLMAKSNGKGVLGNLVIDMDSPVSVAEQIGNALRENGARIMDLFREWDTDNDGEVSRDEFHKAMPKLGLDVDKEVTNALFDSWDADGGGTIDFKELQKQLRVRSSTTTPAPSPRKR